MALLFVDGFDHYTTFAQLLLKWNGTNSGTWTVPTSAGRRGTGCASVTTANSFIIKVLPSAYSTLIAGFAYQPGTAVAALRDFIGFCDTGFTNATVQITIAVDTNMAVRAYRGTSGSGTLLGTSANNAIAAGVFQYIEAKVFVHASAGTVQVKVNGVTVLNLSGINTKNTANTTMSQFGLNTPTNVGNLFDDVYLCDASGTDNNDFLGDSRVDTLMPNGDGFYLNWTPTGGGAHWTQVNAIPPQIATNVSDGSVGDKDTYNFADLTAITGTIFGVAQTLYAQKSDAGTRSVQPLCRSGGVDSAGSAIALGTGANFTPQRILERDPNTGAIWTEAGVNAAQFGQQVA